MQQIRSNRLTALSLGLLVVGSWNVACRSVARDVPSMPESQTAPASAASVHRAAASCVEQAAILDEVRRHRRTASESWREQLARAIYRESVLAQVDPLLVTAIVAHESSFKSRVVSRAGAVGLMQLRPWVARDVARRGAVEWSGRETLNDPSLNVRLGILYYKELVDRFDGDPHAALTAYNYGPTRVSRELRAGTFSGSAYARGILERYRGLEKSSRG